MTGSLTLTSGITPSGSFLTALEAGIATLPAIADTYLQDIITAQGLPFSENIYLWQTENATGLGDPQSEYGNIAVVSPLQQDAGSGIAAPAGYLALIATGETSVNLFDRDNNPNNLVEPANWINEIIIGNQATDSIVGSNAGDVLIGTSQVSTEFWDQQECTIVGSANDSIITGYGDANITTSDYRSLIFAGPASNTINSNGTDTIIGAATGVSTDTVNAYASDLVFGPGSGEMLFNAVGGPDSLVGSQGQISINGSAQDGSVIWGGTGDIFFQGGAGNAAIVQESGEMQILGGSGATTFWGGTGASEITGTAGNSEFVVGEGSSTISAAAGNIVFLIGDAACSIAGTGNGVQINAASSTANNIFQAGAGDETILGGQGNDLFAAGSGNSSLIGGTSADTISLTDGTAGGNITAYEFNASNVTIDLHDYGISAQTFLDSATVSGGSMAFNLPDGSQLNLIGITSLSANQIVST